MNKLSTYKVKKLRKMVRESQTAKPVKNLLLCTIRDYANGGSTPEDGTFGESCNLARREPRCLIGAAVHDLAVHKKLHDFDGGWETEAEKAFGVTISQCSDIIEGFDNGTSRNSSRTRRLANKLRLELIGPREEIFE